MIHARQRVFSTLLSIALVAALLPAITLPVQAATGLLSIGQSSALTLTNDYDELAADGWKWDAATETLTLNSNYTGEAIHIECQLADTVNLSFTGPVNVSATDTLPIFCYGKLVIGGTGTLTATFNPSSNMSAASVRARAGIVINSGTVKAVNNSTLDAVGALDASGDIAITGSANVEIDATAGAYGMICENLTISTTGKVDVSGNIAAYNGNISISGGKTTVTGEVVTADTLSVTGGTVSITGDITGFNGTGGNLSVSDGAVTVSGTIEGTTTQTGGTINGSPPNSGGSTVNYASVTFDANGGSVTPASMQTGTDGKLSGLPIPTRTGSYRFDGWFTQAIGGIQITTGTVFTSHTTVYAHWTYTGGNVSSGSSSGGSSGGSGGGAASSSPAVNAPKDVTTAAASSAAASAAQEAKASGASTATVRIKNPGNISLEALLAMADKTGMPVRFQADSMSTGGVDVRISLDPGKSSKNLNLSASSANDTAKARKAFFEKWFKNKVAVVSLGQQGSFGFPVEIAAKVDLTGMDTKNLVFYSYDKATNAYRRIEKPAYWIDTNGYLHFYTELAGDIIISEGPLEKKSYHTNIPLKG